jgi:hypothetical protein
VPDASHDGFFIILDKLGEADVPVAEVPATARELRRQASPSGPSGAAGKFGAQLTRLENAGFTAFIRLRNDNGVITRGETRTLGGSD